MPFAKTIISSLIALACVAAPASALASADEVTASTPTPNESGCGKETYAVRYAPPGRSPNDLCNPKQVDKRYTLKSPAICNYLVRGAQMCAWVLAGSQADVQPPVQVVEQQYVQESVVRCPMGYDRLPNGDCYLASGGFLWVYPGRAVYVGYGYGSYGYSSYGYRYYNYSRGYSYHPSSRDAPSACSSFGDYHRNGGRAVGRC